MRVLLTSGKGVSGAFIRWWTWSWVAHAALLLDDGTVLDATPSRGVAIHEPDDYERMAVLTVDCDRGVLVRAEEWARGQIGKPYDWRAVLGIGLRRDWRDPARWFCSDLVCEAFEIADFPLIRAEALDRITPRDLMGSERLRPV